MKADPVLLSTLMNLPESERFEIAMAILDLASPFAITVDEITQESARRQDELESGAVRDIGLEELLAGLTYRPSTLPPMTMAVPSMAVALPEPLVMMGRAPLIAASSASSSAIRRFRASASMSGGVSTDGG